MSHTSLITKRSGNTNHEPEISKTWEKFVHSSKKAGYRDGASEGKEVTFQPSFDKGYEEGFKNGFAFGRYNGILRTQTTHSLKSNSNIDNSRRGNCQICSNEGLLNNKIDEIIKTQTESSNSLLKTLHCQQATVVLQKELE